ncbi:MAG TPA: phosphohistidine phosphatase SixA [Polyangiaceae bacterium]
MRLFIMRHGPAEEESSSGRDFDRQLSASGRRRTTAAAGELRRRGEEPELILSSPLVRAVQTAGLVAAVFGGARTDVRDELAPSEDAFALVQELLLGPAASVLVVSHAPDVSILAERLLAESGRRVGAFSPATIAAIELAGGRATSLFTLDAAALTP